MPVLTDEAVATLAVKAWPEAEWVTATAVGLAESDGRTDAVGYSGGWNAGIWQVNQVHGHSQSSLFNPAYNAAAARAVWDKQGWPAWGVYTNGRFRRYIERAKVAVAKVAPGGVGSGDGGGGGGSTGGGLVPDFGITEAAGGIVDGAGDVLSALTPDGLAELVLTVGTALVLVAAGGALAVVALRALASPATSTVTNELDTARSALT